MSMGKDLFFAQHVKVTAQDKVILDIEQLSLPENKTIALIGPNGAGKSTLLRVLMGHYSYLNVLCRGVSSRVHVVRGKIAWVGQHEHFELPVTLLDYVLLGCYPHLSWFSRPQKQEKDSAKKMLDEFDLLPLANKRIHTLSGGEQQRAAIVRALMQKTDILLLDEPSNHLDIRHQYQLMNKLRQYQQKKLNIIMVLHDLNLAANYADHVLLLEQGRLVQSGTVDEVMNSEQLSAVYQWQINKRKESGQYVFSAAMLPA